MTIPGEVIVTLPVEGRFHYLLPEGTAVGERVIVPFGRRRTTGFVVSIGGAPPEGVTLKEALERPDGEAILTPELLELVAFAAGYYLAPAGEILRAALPPGITAASSARYVVTPAGRAALEHGALSPKARGVLTRLAAKKRRLAELTRAEVEPLIAAGLVAREDELGARELVETIEVAERTNIPVVLEALGRAEAQRRVLELLAEGPLPVGAIAELVGASSARRTLKILVSEGWVTLSLRPRAQFRAKIAPTEVATLTLTPGQEAARAALVGALGERKSFLLRGVTGSGKTEVYLRVIEAARDRDLGALVLVPEIALTAQLEGRFRARFGDDVVVLHSAMTDTERRRGWQRLRSGDARIALGPRSAVWAPVSKLGVVVVDEEHDGSFKQSTDVRYHGRDLALYRAHKAACVCVLGSATPSLETRHAVDQGRLTELVLPARATGSALPAVRIVDLAETRAKGQIPLITHPLADALIATVARKEQAIIFLNRRGFNTIVVCASCQEARVCPRCTVSLTHHKHEGRLVCHYCGHAERLELRCKRCGEEEMVPYGAGTERVAEVVAELVPDARVLRLDRDVSAKAGALDETLGAFRAREADVLVGTQMITKGLDFPHVTLVGIVCADTSLALPDFRAAERTFQLVTQVAGRAGRSALPGQVIVQTFQPEHYAILAALHHDDEAFFAREIAGRKELGYPPIGRLGLIRVEGPSEREVSAVSARLAAIAEGLEARVRGPHAAPIAKIKDKHRWMIMVIAPSAAKLVAALGAVKARMPPPPRGVSVIFDVDAVDLG